MSMQGVLLAAGKGTRLQPLTLVRSKAMAPVAGRPLAARVADLLVAQGIIELIVVLSPHDVELRAYFSHQADLGVPVRFVEQAERKGMAHALGLAAPLIAADFIMSACDNLVSVEHVAALVHAHRQGQATATLSLMPIDIAEASKTGIVEWDAPFVRRIVEKPAPEEAPSNIASLPLYVFAPDVLSLLPAITPSPRGEYELQDAIQMLIERTGRVLGVLTEARQQVTNAADLLALNGEYLDRDPGQVVTASPLPDSITLIPPVVIEANVELGPGTVIGPRVYIETGARVGAGAHIQQALILRDGEVPAHSTVNATVVAGNLAVHAAAPRHRLP